MPSASRKVAAEHSTLIDDLGKTFTKRIDLDSVLRAADRQTVLMDRYAFGSAFHFVARVNFAEHAIRPDGFLDHGRLRPANSGIALRGEALEHPVGDIDLSPA